jgi:hypothetical protein
MDKPYSDLVLQADEISIGGKRSELRRVASRRFLMIIVKT